MSEKIKNVVLVGRTGNGKSATGNTILGQKLFTSKLQAGGVTMECEMYRAAIQDGPIIQIIDTPGLFDSSVSEEYISREIINCLNMADEGIHAVLFVLSVKNRIAQEEESTYKTLLSIFDTKIVDYFIVVFTGGDELEEDNQTLDDYLRHGCPEFLTKVLKRCRGRKVLFNNKTTNKDKKAAQLKKLLAHMADVENQTGRPYTDQMHRHIKESKRIAAQAEEADDLKLEYDEKLRRMTQIMQRKIKANSEAHIKAMNELREALNQPLPQFRVPPPECNIM